MDKIVKIKNILQDLKEVKFAYLFGSYAIGKHNYHSDIDIAVYLNENTNDFDTKLKIHHILEIKLKKDIDLIVLNNAKNYNLLDSIFRNNILLKESTNDERILFELKKEHEILDYKEFQRMLSVA